MVTTKMFSFVVSSQLVCYVVCNSLLNYLNRVPVPFLKLRNQELCHEVSSANRLTLNKARENYLCFLKMSQDL